MSIDSPSANGLGRVSSTLASVLGDATVWFMRLCGADTLCSTFTDERIVLRGDGVVLLVRGPGRRDRTVLGMPHHRYKNVGQYMRIFAEVTELCRSKRRYEIRGLLDNAHVALFDRSSQHGQRITTKKIYKYFVWAENLYKLPC
jgi:hypothetical protein